MTTKAAPLTSASLPAAPTWQGINHLALITPDMDTTVRFYAGTLGMPLVATTMAGPMRHYFFEIGPGNTVAFFEVAGMETFSKPAGARPDRPMQFDHLSFNVADEAALLALRDRLIAAGTEVTDVVDHKIIRSIYFTDPNGLALEASWWATDPTGGAPLLENPSVFADPDPVPAVAELDDIGSLPPTRLS